MKTTNQIKQLEYGMKILFPCTPVSYVMPEMGIAISSSSTPKEKILMEVCKYWEDDTDANRYKVALKPVNEEDRFRFGNEKLYSCDLKSLIRCESCDLVLD